MRDDVIKNKLFVIENSNIFMNNLATLPQESLLQSIVDRPFGNAF